MSHGNKKPLPRNRIFVQTPFSHSTLKLVRNKFTPQNHSLFRSISCFGVTRIPTPIWLQKSWKCVNRSWKKKTAPQYNSNSLKCKKKTKRRPIIAPVIAVRLLKMKKTKKLEIALKKVINITNALQKTFINVNHSQFKTGTTKILKKDEENDNCRILGSKTPKNDLLTLNYGLPSSFFTLSTCRTTKRC